MNRGIVIIAFDTEYLEYTKIARFCAKRAKEFLKLPITLITDKEFIDPNVDNVIYTNNERYQHRTFGSDLQKWRNFNRADVYDLSPYDHTLLIDCDYVINSDQLNSLWDLDKSFLCHGTTAGVTKFSNSLIESLGQYELNMCWATVVMFKKDQFSKSIFHMWKMIQQNYIYYAALFKFNNQLYRNDYALTIALNTMTGHLGYDEFLIKYPLINIFTDVEVKRNEDEFEFYYQKMVASTLRPYRVKLSNTDFHCMNKKSLLEFING